jgi:hypothetical protein
MLSQSPENKPRESAKTKTMITRSTIQKQPPQSIWQSRFPYEHYIGISVSSLEYFVRVARHAGASHCTALLGMAIVWFLKPASTTPTRLHILLLRVALVQGPSIELLCRRDRL